MSNNDLGTRVKGNFYVYGTGNLGLGKIVTVSYGTASEFIMRVWGTTSGGSYYDDRIISCIGTTAVVTNILHNVGGGNLDCTSVGNYKIKIPHYDWEYLVLIGSSPFNISFS